MEIAYEGSLHCQLTHGPSGVSIQTDAPKDNQGKGEAFSPTDLVAAALGSCILTTMAIYAKRHDKELGKMTAQVTKEMSADAPRRISRIAVKISMPKGLSEEDKTVYERVAASCPVHKSLHPDTQAVITFTYPV